MSQWLRSSLLSLAASLAVAAPAAAAVAPFPPAFQVSDIAVPGATIHVHRDAAPDSDQPSS